jgi:hypothetical protein
MTIDIENPGENEEALKDAIAALLPTFLPLLIDPNDSNRHYRVGTGPIGDFDLDGFAPAMYAAPMYLANPEDFNQWTGEIYVTTKGTGGQPFKMGIYTDGSGYPGSKVSESVEGDVGDGGVGSDGEIFAVTFSTPPTERGWYWVAVLFSAPGTTNAVIKGRGGSLDSFDSAMMGYADGDINYFIANSAAIVGLVSDSRVYASGLPATFPTDENTYFINNKPADYYFPLMFLRLNNV